DDDYYFESYDHYSIHEEMLKDKVRTQSYKDAMIMNPSSFAKKVVIDLGCGTSILSMFAVQAGAELVYAIDQSEIIYTAMDIVRWNGLEKKIKCIKSKIEEAKLPCKKVDIIVSEWMGYFLLFESMLESVIYCRDNFLAPGGLVLPSHCNIFLGAFDSSKYWRSRVKYWDDVYGFKMSCIKTAIITEVDVDVLGAESVLTDICCIKQLDIMTVQSEDLDFDSSFRLLALRDGVIHGFFGFFDTVFDLKNRVEFSTGPFEPETHWKQSIFLLAQPIPVCKGQHIDGRIYVKRSKKDHRSLDVNIIIGNKKHKYFMN
ncbi:hypothetical protein HELRODRAFT_87604, partial [Helobdella robusta]|uniref:type I protein arginine methyltransferase n=1 Tax=Helobdella robusta TaxID=6412 RepID=T1G6S8_HELRO